MKEDPRYADTTEFEYRSNEIAVNGDCKTHMLESRSDAVEWRTDGVEP
jgi:hypothetical protein